MALTLLVKADFHRRVIFRAYARKWKRGNVWKATRKRERWARFNCYVTRDFPYILSILLTRVKFTRVRTKKLRNSGNPPLGRLANSRSHDGDGNLNVKKHQF